MKSTFNFKLMRKDGSSVNMHELNFWVNYARIQPIRFTRQSQTVEGYDGFIETHTQINTRYIETQIQVEAYDTAHLESIRNKIYALFNPTEEFYFIRDLDPFKRYKVKVAELTGLEYEEGSLEDGYFAVTFEMFKPYAESVGTSLDLANKKTWDAGLWGWDMGVDWDETYQCTFNFSTFVVKNIGNVAIDPCQNDLEITLQGSFSNGVRIINHTTGDVFEYNAALSATDVLKLSGIRAFKNGVSALKATNKKLLTLASGDNHITIEGGTVMTIAFNFRFLYH
ncbi:phage tail family protein [Lysinibacillus sp. LZ02]|uniref:phage tail family protein n=1 Tax=Lysinibacillus sp. LZ02 TaxID=3420668 RepID=UPI003D36F0C0